MAATPDCPSVWFSKVMVWISPHCQFAGSLPWVWVRASTAAANWQWGDVHTITFENQTLGQSGVSAVEWLFNRGPYPVSGSTSVVNATSWGTQDLPRPARETTRRANRVPLPLRWWHSPPCAWWWTWATYPHPAPATPPANPATPSTNTTAT